MTPHSTADAHPDLDTLAAALPGRLVRSATTPSTPVVDCTHDSRQVEPGWLFACLRGAAADGHDFAADAVAAGAVGLVVDHELDLDVPQLVVDDVRAALGPIAAAVHGQPSAELDVFGVTGTAGKTTVTQLLAAIFEAAGRTGAVSGTLSGARTTPEAPDLQRFLAESKRTGANAIAMEVSSHALSLHRVDGTRFRVVGFTNLGHDHLDFHRTVEEYLDAKAELFSAAFAPVAVLNLDDPAGAEIADRVRRAGDLELVGYRLADAVDLRVDGAVTRFRWRDREVVLRLAGRHNVANALCAATMAEAAGLDPDSIADGLCRAEAPRGRFEFVNIGQDFHVVVDYAHKPEAVAAVLDAARQVAAEHRVIVVLGAGGDRDQQKRAPMGAAAAAGADLVVITSDNPRSEDPDAIAEAVLAGIPADAAAPTVELDRRRAIAHALGQAVAGDVVVIAGKGHETYQETAGVREPFDDRQVAIEQLLEKGAIA